MNNRNNISFLGDDILQAVSGGQASFGPVTCQTCNKTFTNYDSFEEHVISNPNHEFEFHWTDPYS